MRAAKNLGRFMLPLRWVVVVTRSCGVVVVVITVVGVVVVYKTARSHRMTGLKRPRFFAALIRVPALG